MRLRHRDRLFEDVGRTHQVEDQPTTTAPQTKINNPVTQPTNPCKGRLPARSIKFLKISLLQSNSLVVLSSSSQTKLTPMHALRGNFDA